MVYIRNRLQLNISLHGLLKHSFASSHSISMFACTEEPHNFVQVLFMHHAAGTGCQEKNSSYDLLTEPITLCKWLRASCVQGCSQDTHWKIETSGSQTKCTWSSRSIEGWILHGWCQSCIRFHYANCSGHYWRWLSRARDEDLKCTCSRRNSLSVGMTVGKSWQYDFCQRWFEGLCGRR